MHARGPAPYMHVEQKKSQKCLSFSFSGCWGQNRNEKRGQLLHLCQLCAIIVHFLNGFGFNVA